MSVSYSGTPHSVTGPDLQDTVSVDNEVNTQPDKTSRRLRLNWTELEDLRLVIFFTQFMMLGLCISFLLVVCVGTAD